MQAALKSKTYSSVAAVTGQTLISQIGSKAKLVGMQAVAPAGGGNSAACIIYITNPLLNIIVAGISQTTNGASRHMWFSNENMVMPATGMSLSDAGYAATEGVYGGLPFGFPLSLFDTSNSLTWTLNISTVCAGAGVVNLYYIEDDENAIGHV